MNILETQLEHLIKLVQTIKSENEILSMKDRNPHVLATLIEEKITLQQQLASIEDKRFEVMGNVTLTEYAQNQEEDLLGFVSNFKETLAELADLIEINKLLIGVEMQYYEGVLTTISDSTKAKMNTYGQAGKMYRTEIQRTSLFNKKV